MLARISYIVLGFLVGVGCFFTVVSMNDDTVSLAKTGRLEPASAPVGFVMERFAG